nr:AAA family ATPase [Polyangiaceae bacterium]
MSRLKIKKISIRGFRSFGHAHQTAEPSDTVSVFAAGNSQGKTSLAEAIEFLLTGQIARRDLLAGAKDEFAESLRNAHVDDKVEVVVEAVFETDGGRTTTLRRVLVDDYRRAGASECTSRVEIDGAVANEDEIASRIGISFFPAPLRAPVLSQHSLGFLFSSSPADRAAYFRSVLDTQSLEDFRHALTLVRDGFEYPVGPELDDFKAAGDAFPDLASALKKARSRGAVAKAVDEKVSALITSAGIITAGDKQVRLHQLESELERRRSILFPLRLLARRPFTAWAGPESPLIQEIDTFIEQRAQTDVEAQKLVALFEAALAIPHVHHAVLSIECPLCASPDTLTPARVGWIADQARDNAAYNSARMELLSTLSALSVQVDIGATAARRATPEIIQMTVATRRNAGATVTSMRNLVSDKALVSDWLADLKALWRIWRAQEKGAAGVREELAAVAVDPQTWSRTAELLKSLGEFVVKQRGFAAALASLEGPSRRIEAEIKRQIDVSTQVAGWEALTRMGKDIEGVERALTQSRKYDAELKAMDKAIADVEKGIGIVVDQKFADLSDGVRKWWDLLRPEEATYFDTIQR